MLPKTNRERLLASLDEFDRDFRHTSEWLDWEQNRSQVYALEREGRRYPPKKIVSIATGVPTDGFSGGSETNSYLEDLGFRIITLRAGDELTQEAEEVGLRRGFELVMATFDRSERAARGAKVWPHFEGLEGALHRLVTSWGRPHLGCYGSLGAGNLAAVPWLMVYDDRETTTSQRGLYCVYLFAADMSGVFLTLNQGCQDYLRKHGQPRTREFLKQQAESLRPELRALEQRGFQLDAAINLHSEKALARLYEIGAVTQKHYAAGAVPPDEVLQRDLEALVSNYEQILTDREVLGRRPAKAWLFQANPDLFNLHDALRQLPSLTFEVNQSAEEIRAGDQVFLWESGAKGGLLGTATIMGDPNESEMLAEETGFAQDPKRFAGVALRVPLRIDLRAKEAISRERLKAEPRLANMPFLRFSQGTNFPVSPEEASTLLELLEAVAELDQEATTTSVPQSSRVWLFAPGRDAEVWDECYRDGILAIEWDELGDLSQYADLESLSAHMKDVYQKEAEPRNDALTCYDFCRTMRPGDLVFAKKGRSTILGHGVITGEYRHDASRSGYRNLRAIRWDSRGSWTVPKPLAIKTLTNIAPYPKLVEQLLQLIGSEASEAVPTVAPQSLLDPYTVEEALKDLFLSRDEFERILRLWRSKINLVLQGPPGVGKTFVARRLAYALIGKKDPSRVAMVQFHPSFSYEDFVQGYRPNGSGFSLKNGLFYEFCRRAIADQDSKYVFIIDEINRAHLGKVLGELMMLIEADKRGSTWSVPLAYASSPEEQFHVPPNLFLLGLMNTADRSLSLVDYALRRRFAFITLQPSFVTDAFRSNLQSRGADTVWCEKLGQRFEELNAEIRKDRNLGPGFQVGHSYFCGDRKPSAAWYQDVIDSEVLPLLEEYWFDDPARVDQWRLRLVEGLV